MNLKDYWSSAEICHDTSQYQSCFSGICVWLRVSSTGHTKSVLILINDLNIRNPTLPLCPLVFHSVLLLTRQDLIEDLLSITLQTLEIVDHYVPDNRKYITFPILAWAGSIIYPKVSDYDDLRFIWGSVCNLRLHYVWTLSSGKLK